MRWSHALPAAAMAAAAVLGAPAEGVASGEPGAHLALTLHNGEGTSGQPLNRAVLECDPDGGTHPDPRAACTALRAAGGDLAAVKARSGTMCPMIYAPITVQATGHWAGRTVAFTRSYANRCTAANESGGVFQFRTSPAQAISGIHATGT